MLNKQACELAQWLTLKYPVLIKSKYGDICYVLAEWLKIKLEKNTDSF